MKNSHLAIGVVSGMAVGAVIGILCAPDKGCNIRKQIMEKGSELKNNLKEGVENIATSIKDESEKIMSIKEGLHSKKPDTETNKMK